MKRLIVFTLIAIISTLFVSCGSNGGNSNSGALGGDASSQVDRKSVV